MRAVSTRLTLEQAPTGSALVIAGTSANPHLAHRLMTLGWRVGAGVRIVRKSVSGARIIDLNGARVAVSRDLAGTLLVERP